MIFIKTIAKYKVIKNYQVFQQITVFQPFKIASIDQYFYKEALASLLDY